MANKRPLEKIIFIQELCMADGAYSYFLLFDIVSALDNQLRKFQDKTFCFLKAELAERIYLYFKEVNEEPVVFHWKYNLDDIDVSEEIIVDTLPLKKSS